MKRDQTQVDFSSGCRKLCGMKLSYKLMHVSLSLMFLSGLSAESRTWKNNQGKSFKASLVEVKEGHVVLRSVTNGKTYTVPLNTLSKDDQAFIGNLADKDLKGQDGNSGQAASNPNVIETKVIKGKDNYADSWPSIVKMSNKTEVTGSEKDGNFIYTSPRFEFISDVRLSHSVVNQFSVLFEATAEYMKVLPISSHKAQVTSKRHKIYLFENKETYFKNGGPLGSAGVYIPSKEIIMVPLTSLGVRKAGSGYILDRDKSNKTLPHEIAHIVTDPAYYAHGSIGWFSEGLAEYVGSTPYRGGIYNIRSVQSSLEKYVTEFGKNNTGGRNLGTKINSVNLKDFMLMPYGQFVQNGNKNYGLGALYTYYFFHWDDDGSRDNLTAFLKALKEGKRGEEAIDLLRADRTWEELEEEVASAWRKRGVKITFGE